ncbi:sigma-70 family RNA polymerase sigma factor [Spirillospora sp. NBC_00431]
MPAPLTNWSVDDYRTEMRRLTKIAMAAGATVQEAEDAMQAALTDLVRRVRAGQTIHSPRAYTRRAVLNYFINAAERDRKHRRRLIDAGYSHPEELDDPGLTVWEDKQFVTELLAELPPTQRQVLEHVMDGLTTSEISDLLGKKPATIRQNLKLARDRLRPALEHLRNRPVQGERDHRSDEPDPPPPASPTAEDQLRSPRPRRRGEEETL